MSRRHVHRIFQKETVNYSWCPLCDVLTSNTIIFSKTGALENMNESDTHIVIIDIIDNNMRIQEVSANRQLTGVCFMKRFIQTFQLNGFRVSLGYQLPYPLIICQSHHMCTAGN